MRRPLLMMRTRGLTGPFFGRHVGNRASHPLAHSAGNFYSVPIVDPLGPELVTNGTFDTDTTWTKQANWSIAGGVAIGVTPGAQFIGKTIGIVIGTLYRVEYEIVTITAGTLQAKLGTATGSVETTVGVKIENIVCAGSSSLTINKDALFDGTIDNVSVKEVL